ncbi:MULTISPECIES: 3-hydroxybutyrate dehydrogenase [Testudinibacter]|uniref:3-hydroxybutyrate dehydrogenase n=1 Tax=Testudinibacter aquarius TaxID=1524974 RepID=A0A4R3YAD7_9PAST|nr:MULTISPECIES: 3-hydroxybutyrate dehydrogenase [Testudinibacter]TNG92385.1 3-hydroxybutyrate dehydrogenase [Pasteurellaceae bacterium USgator41]TNG94183.1 3-hydroxybutyrate dehydrogenase [Pasteurellaceae bacterium UScroc12]TNG96149.1 3-hydroxybutyrate dehydrogenase [Pasteurellaceae bacterium UScroc31]TNH01998.1 3-hydroxybutyrate dehydrogenase [Pasteurellaceae bacterium USgator11]TNH06197.1 3-hydroxybutyrate dehydrogenase [Pasteurellaceae bacterium Phil11]
MIDVNGKVAVITGSASGIGLHMAKKFLANGAKVVISDVNEEALAARLQELNHPNLLAVKTDVTKEAEIENLISTAHKHFGRLDIFVNNAGIQHVASIEDFPTEKFDLMIQIMLRASFLTIKHCLPIMKAQKFGRIINVSSINGLVGFAGKVAYNAAKHGIIGITRVAALECAKDGVTVNAICPGYIETPLVLNQMKDLAKTRNVSLENVLEEVLYPLIPQKTLIDIDDIASLVLFASSPCAKHITGTNLVIDAGYTAQ